MRHATVAIIEKKALYGRQGSFDFASGAANMG